MATSRSAEAVGARSWTAGASVFSGRRDPSRTVTPEEGARLVAIWESLPAAERNEARPPPPLGYRGAWLRDPRGVAWRAYGGIVSVEPAGMGRGETRRDEGRVMEQGILRTAPPGLLPEGLIP